MDGIDRLSYIIPYIQLFNGYGWTGLDGSMAEGAGFEPAVRVNAHTLSKRASLGCFTEKRPLLQMALYPELAYPEHHFQPVLRMMGSVLPTSQAECYSTAQLWQC